MRNAIRWDGRIANAAISLPGEKNVGAQELGRFLRIRIREIPISILCFPWGPFEGDISRRRPIRIYPLRAIRDVFYLPVLIVTTKGGRPPWETLPVLPPQVLLTALLVRVDRLGITDRTFGINDRLIRKFRVANFSRWPALGIMCGSKDFAKRHDGEGQMVLWLIWRSRQNLGATIAFMFLAMISVTIAFSLFLSRGSPVG